MVAIKKHNQMEKLSNSVVKSLNLPPTSIIRESFEEAHYIDTYCISVCNPQNYSIDYITGIFFTSLPNWIKKLLSFRNFIVKFFGLEGGHIDKLKKPDKSVYYDIGSTAVMFKVHSRNNNEIVMADNDKHLNFRTSLLIEKTDKQDIYNLYSATIVHYNNIWGQLYFIPVKPFHRIIVKSLLKKAIL